MVIKVFFQIRFLPAASRVRREPSKTFFQPRAVPEKLPCHTGYSALPRSRRKKDGGSFNPMLAFRFAIIRERHEFINDLLLALSWLPAHASTIW
jgi:hypothetical protein